MSSRHSSRFILAATILIITLFPLTDELRGQSWERDSRATMEIPAVVTMESSPAHLYVLSEEEGLVVFRTYEESLQWLYSSEGMERRGHRLQTDIRFGYLYGDSPELTVVEPTSVLGVYSSTELPDIPRSVVRLDNHIYVALGEWGLGRLSLATPEDVDTAPDRLIADQLEERTVRDLVSDPYARIYLLADEQNLLVLEADDPDEEPGVERTISLDRTTDRLFLTDDELLGSDEAGELFLIGTEGGTETIADVEEPINRVRVWNGSIAIRTESGELWLGQFGEQPEKWGSNGSAGHHFATVGNRLWIAENNRLAPLVRVQDSGRPVAGADEPPRLRPIDPVTVPHPRPVLVPLELESDHDPSEIEFSYRSDITNATIRGQSFYWQPSSNQTGRHTFTIIASTATGEQDTTELRVNVRPFNTPPRFSSTPAQTIRVDEPFTFEVPAFDPDGMDSDLLRFIGVDMPDGASLDERSGEFHWTPSIRQAGEHTFQVIATDQFGAANSTDITIRVVETDPEEEADLDLPQNDQPSEPSDN